MKADLSIPWAKVCKTLYTTYNICRWMCKRLSSEKKQRSTIIPVDIIAEEATTGARHLQASIGFQSIVCR